MVKKAYIKTLEAIIAAVLILIVVFTILPKATKQEASTPNIVKSSQQFILKQIASNETLRSCIVSNSCESFYIESVIIENLPPGYDYAFKICDSPNCIEQTPIDKSVFMDDILISSDQREQNPKIVRIWFWRR